MNDLLTELYAIMQQYDMDGQLKSRLILVLDNYEISPKTTEVGFYDFDEYNESIVKQFLVSKMVAGLTQKSVNQYQNRLQFILDRINKPVNLITDQDIKVYISKRRVFDKLAESSITNEYRTLNSFFNWMTREELIDRNPMIKLDPPKKRKKKKKAFTQMEVEMLRNACITLREKAIIEVLLSTWCRVSEVANMDIVDIKDNAMTVLGKGEKERTVYLNSKALLALKLYLGSRKDNERGLFVSSRGEAHRLSDDGIYDIVKKIGARAGVDNVHPHRFRRTGATFALKAGMGIEKVSYLLGHDSIETTQIYLDIVEDDAREAHMKYVA